MNIQPVQLLYPLLDKIPLVDNYFSNAKEEYTSYRKKKLLKAVEKPAIFVYQIEKADGKKYTGITAAISLKDQQNGKIKGHENTLVTKEIEQLKLLEERKAQVKPILLTYPKVVAVEQWIAAVQESHEVFLELNLKKTIHRIWRVDGRDVINKAQKLFEDYVPQTYIADGHHRTAVMARWGAANEQETFLYCTLFSSDQIEILSFNRVVDGVEERSLKAFIREMKELCDVRKIDKPFTHPPKHCLQMYVRKQWYALIWKPKVLASCEHLVEQLDPYLLDQRILQKVMHIKNIRESNQVKYISGLEGNIKKIMAEVDKKKDRIGFYLPAIQMNDFLAVVNSGNLLPPKSTWFEPRMLNGLLVYSLE